jgi:hypothetical protein
MMMMLYQSTGSVDTSMFSLRDYQQQAYRIYAQVGFRDPVEKERVHG